MSLTAALLVSVKRIVRRFPGREHDAVLAKAVGLALLVVPHALTRLVGRERGIGRFVGQLMILDWPHFGATQVGSILRPSRGDRARAHPDPQSPAPPLTGGCPADQY